MLSRHVNRQLPAYLHEELSAKQRLYVESHLRACSQCREAHKEISRGAEMASILSPSPAPESIWHEIHKARMSGDATRETPRWLPKTAFAGLIIAGAVVAVLLLSLTSLTESPSWEVTGIPGIASLRPGDALETNASSGALVRIADIGELAVAPNSRIRLLVTRADEHRIALDHGKVEAVTTAPPRLFMVETPAVTAIDLGCKYTLEVEDDGATLLHVELGLVALDQNGRETVVPAGAFCRTRPGAGPGTPFLESSSEKFQSSLDYVDFAKEGPERAEQLETLLREARPEDASTLRELLTRLDAQSRDRVNDRIAQLAPSSKESQ